MRDGLTNREMVAVINETLARELAPAIAAAVRAALEGVDLEPARQAAARRELHAEEREVAAAAEEQARRLHEARSIAARTLWERVGQLSPGDVTGHARGLELFASGWPAPHDYLPRPSNWRERR